MWPGQRQNKRVAAACVGRCGSASEAPGGLKLLPAHHYPIQRGDPGPPVAARARVIASRLPSRRAMKGGVRKKKPKRYDEPVFSALSFEALHPTSAHHPGLVMGQHLPAGEAGKYSLCSGMPDIQLKMWVFHDCVRKTEWLLGDSHGLCQLTRLKCK